jgi:hypothetical protein
MMLQHSINKQYAYVEDQLLYRVEARHSLSTHSILEDGYASPKIKQISVWLSQHLFILSVEL